MTAEESSNLDTSIACDSCDLWYHAFCVGFDPEGTCEDTWLCPRCVAEVPQKSSIDLTQKTKDHSGPENANGDHLAESMFPRKVSVSVADAGETAVVVSMIGDEWTEEPNENFQSMLEIEKGFGIEAFNPYGRDLEAKSELNHRIDIQSMLQAQELELSLSQDASFCLPSTSLGSSEVKTDGADEKLNEQSNYDGVKSFLGKTFNEPYPGNKPSDSISNVDLHLGLSMVADTKKDLTDNQITGYVQQQNPSEESLLKADKTEPGANEENSQNIGGKRNHDNCSGINEEIKTKETEVPAKKIRAERLTQTNPHKDEANASILADSKKFPTLIVGRRDDKSKLCPEKAAVTSDIMSIVKGTKRKLPKGLALKNSADKSSKDRENVSGLRVKKIMKRPAEDKDSSELVQELRKEIREAVRNRSSKDIGENLFDPQLLAAFRAAIAGPKCEPVKKPEHLAVKVKKSMLEKGKVRESLTKKIYGNSNGRRRRAWNRDCEVEFWKYRCMRATKTEKIETLKSVLDLLRNNSQSSDTEQATGCQETNPILSRLYLADTSVFPRKDNIMPLSALKATDNSEQSEEQVISIEKPLKLSSDNYASKVAETNKVSSKVGVLSVYEKGTRNISCSKSNAAPKKVHPTQLGDSKVNSLKGTAKSDDVKVDKRKWALEILARKTAVASKSATREKMEDTAMLTRNYPLLARLPADMKPVLAPGHHNKIPISVRQTQLYRLTEFFLRKANLPVIRRTAETELAVADAVNIEKEAADRSNSKLVYLNLCSQEISRRSDNKKSTRATESNSSAPPAVPIDELERATDELSNDHSVEEALRNAGLLSDSPPNSPHHPTEVKSEVDISSTETREEGPDNVFEMESHPEMDIYGDFEYDLEDEDFIGVNAMKVSNLQPEEVSKVKVVFSTLNSEKLNKDNKDGGGLEKNDEHKDSTCLLESHSDAVIRSSTTEDGTSKPCVPPESLPCEESDDLSLAECEELYGPDKEPLVDKFPEVSQKPCGLLDGEAQAENKCAGEGSDIGSERHDENISCGKEKSTDNVQTDDRTLRKESESNASSEKQRDGVNLVSKKVETYIKEHIRPLCKSGIITAEQYRWAVAKTTDKVMKYHSNAKNANFLIKEGEKVKKLAEQYVEAAAQQKGKVDPQ